MTWEQHPPISRCKPPRSASPLTRWLALTRTPPARPLTSQRIPILILWDFYDLGAASSYLTLQAAALGLTTHQMAGFDPDAARQAFEIPEDSDLNPLGFL